MDRAFQWGNCTIKEEKIKKGVIKIHLFHIDKK